MNKAADVCLILEGTYPYIRGGVSTWTHELIKAQDHLTFHILAILPPDGKTKLCYEMPENVIGITNVTLQKLPKGVAVLPEKQMRELFSSLEIPLLNMQTHASVKQLKKIIDILVKFGSAEGRKLGSAILLDSDSAWKMVLRMYNSTMGNTCFLDYFWSWRALLGGLYSVLLAPLPEARLYHALCTGYAGLYLSRAHLETGKPCLLTEHGIYTNERRIEIASVDWLEDQKALDFNITPKKAMDRNLRDFWIDSFVGYSKICYQCCKHIITLYDGNKQFQIADGAEFAKITVIPNGIDYDYYSQIVRNNDNHPPTIAMIGRVVPIKDVKTYIRACKILKNSIPDLRAYIIGPVDEDEEYSRECVEIVEHLNLSETIIFTGLVKLADYLGQIDVQVLTSISEAQPLVVLEAGAAGIPSVTTDVGACREMIFGMSNENPQLGAGGDIAPLSDPKAIASKIHKLLTDRDYYNQCSRVMKERVRKYYNKTNQHKAYRKLYADI